MKRVNSRLSAVMTAAAQIVHALLLLLHGGALLTFHRLLASGVLHDGGCRHRFVLLQSTQQGPQCSVLLCMSMLLSENTPVSLDFFVAFFVYKKPFKAIFYPPRAVEKNSIMHNTCNCMYVYTVLRSSAAAVDLSTRFKLPNASPVDVHTLEISPSGRQPLTPTGIVLDHAITCIFLLLLHIEKFAADAKAYSLITSSQLTAA